MPFLFQILILFYFLGFYLMKVELNVQLFNYKCVNYHKYVKFT